MTVRRDLIELENEGILIKTHSGARSNLTFQYREVSHKERHTRQIAEKRFMARRTASLIEDGDTSLFGPETIVELLTEEVDHHMLTIITNCLPVCKVLLEKQTAHFRVYLIGGETHHITETFVGEMANAMLEKLRFSRVFFSNNTVNKDAVMASTLGEVYTRQLALSNSIEKHLLIDHMKAGEEDFASSCQLDKLTVVVTDYEDEERVEAIKTYIEVVDWTKNITALLKYVSICSQANVNLYSFMGYLFANLCKREPRQISTTIPGEYLIRAAPQQECSLIVRKYVINKQIMNILCWFTACLYL